jgi:hypothetical protein
MKRSDPLARRTALALGAARTGLGVGALFLTRPTLKALLFGATDSTGTALAKLAGGRDLAMGLATIAARDEPTVLRQLTGTAGLLDAADAVAMGLSARDPDTRLAALGGVASAVSGALASAWVWKRLGS